MEEENEVRESPIFYSQLKIQAAELDSKKGGQKKQRKAEGKGGGQSKPRAFPTCEMGVTAREKKSAPNARDADETTLETPASNDASKKEGVAQ